ncbi:MAG: HEPN domain-containing protein [Dehalococcoidia bacterium]|nr:HEPN domain-containing protein [Dehalococcoidia bacterium]MSQ16231.1 HEPN domain-containing protein [Dehalococcoidia bacterium]
MKKPLETARRWLAQAEYSLSTTRVMLDNSRWSDVCFHAEQTAQLALKAFLYWKGRRSVTIHSVRSLALECGREDAEFLPFEDHGTVLDRYYLSTRYPDVLPEPAIPFQTFTQRDARQALDYASEIVELVRAKVPS